jgi:hypothetical protein
MTDVSSQGRQAECIEKTMMSNKPVFWVYWISTSLVCAGYLLGAVVYTFKHDMVAQGMQQFGYPVYLTYLLPVVKVLGPLAILSRVSVALSDLAYAGMFYHMVLAFSAHVTSGVPGWPGAVMVFALMLIPFSTQNAVRKPPSPSRARRRNIAIAISVRSAAPRSSTDGIPKSRSMPGSWTRRT